MFKMEKIKLTNLKLGLCSAVIVFVLDQLTKFVIFKNFSFPGESLRIFPFFNLTYVQNKGISFGMLNSGNALSLLIIFLITLTILSVIFYWLNNEKDKINQILLGLIIGGAIGNLIDRFTYSFVVDFIDFYYKSYHYPAFNIADSSICIAVILLLLTSRTKG